MRTVFWLSALCIAYVYVGYPLLLAAWTRVRSARSEWDPDPVNTPDVTIVIAARNEASRLPGRIRNLLAADYPAGRRQIVVVSDGSTDGTEAALAPFAGVVDVVTVPPGGKAAALNAGVARARHGIVVFADARQTFAPDALRALVAPFADPAIGGVTGELVLGCEESAGRRTGHDRRGHGTPPLDDRQRLNRRREQERRGHLASSVADGVGLYWRYEKALRRMESRAASTLGATGAIYALRRSLWQPLPAETILDDVLAPMRAVLAGYRVVFNESATAFDHTPADSAAESRRKVRTLAGNVQILWLEPRLLIPGVNPLWLQYFSHKVGRLLVPYALLALMASSIALAEQHAVYGVALAGQCGLYLLSAYGAWLERNAPQAARPATEPAKAGWAKGPVNA